MVVPNSKVKGKGKGHPEEATEARGGVDYSYTLPSTSALEGVGIQRHAPAALPPGETRYTLYRRLDGLQGRSGRVRKILPPTGIRSLDRSARSQSLYQMRYPGSLVPKCT